MTETVVHVTTIEEWKSVLDVWFKQGYKWSFGEIEYFEFAFNSGARFLLLSDNKIYRGHGYVGLEFIEYSEFMAQQKEDNKMATYYVTQEQLDLIKDLKEGDWPLSRLVNSQNIFRPLNEGLKMIEEKALLRYLGGDTSIEFKVKEQLYRLWRIDDDGDKCYMNFNSRRTPFYTMAKENAFTAPLDEIKKWQTPSWDWEKAI